LRRRRRRQANSARRFFRIALTKLESGQLFLKDGNMQVYFLPKQRERYKRTNNYYFLMFHWIHGHVYGHVCVYIYTHARMHAPSKKIN
jgi:hypothetical protein